MIWVILDTHIITHTIRTPMIILDTHRLPTDWRTGRKREIHHRQTLI